MPKNPTAYILAGNRNNLDFTYNWYKDIFELECAARFLESQGYTTRAWRCTDKREQLW